MELQYTDMVYQRDKYKKKYEGEKNKKRLSRKRYPKDERASRRIV